MAQTITVTLENNNGQVTAQVETKGFKGKACKDATADLERAMGMKTSDRNTPEFDLREQQQAGS